MRVSDAATHCGSGSTPMLGGGIERRPLFRGSAFGMDEWAGVGGAPSKGPEVGHMDWAVDISYVGGASVYGRGPYIRITCVYAFS